MNPSNNPTPLRPDAQARRSPPPPPPLAATPAPHAPAPSAPPPAQHRPVETPVARSNKWSEMPMLPRLPTFTFESAKYLDFGFGARCK